jgi:ATP-dependent 26S proteasome regulatory subunit
LIKSDLDPLSVDLITEATTIKDRDYDAFDDLVLPPRHRKIIRALVKTHARARSVLDSEPSKTSIQREFDIVRGKGKGLIILLHGSPGVGKTSTAECVAAHTGRPLFPITCGDLGGNTAQEVEQNLERFFDLAMRWGCVLLLDEADVFLGERIKGNIQQNSLVSGKS